VLCIFLGLIIATSILLPFPIQQSEYVSVDIKLVLENTDTFYRQNISSTATVNSEIAYLHSNYFVGTSEGVFLFFKATLSSEPPELALGARIYFRGTILNNSVSVHEFHVLDYNSSIIRSIPGIVLFIAMFFMVFKFDFKRLAFVSKEGGSEGA